MKTTTEHAAEIRFVVVDFTPKGPRTIYAGAGFTEAKKLYENLENGTFFRQTFSADGDLTGVNYTLGRK